MTSPKPVLKILRSFLRTISQSKENVSSPTKTHRGGYVSANEIVSSAAAAEKTVCEYVEELWNKQGCTAAVIDQMDKLGAFKKNRQSILEIGAGTGRYLEKVLERCSPANYESYETAEDWANWLAKTYPITSIPCDGISLSQTTSNSIDLIHAHGVFVYLPFLVSVRYWQEMWRVANHDSIIFFDIYSEDCFDDSSLKAWIDSAEVYPCFLSKEFVIKQFEKNGFTLLHSFLSPHGAANSQYLAFIR